MTWICEKKRPGGASKTPFSSSAPTRAWSGSLSRSCPSWPRSARPRCGGLSKAAKRLYITTSALSKFVLQREGEVGVKLFNRDGNHFTLTYAGERYLTLLEEVETAQRKLREEMGKAADLYMGKLRIGLQRTMAESAVKKVLPQLRERYQDIAISFVEDSTAVLKQKLSDQELDIVLATAEEEELAFREERICEAHIILAGPKDPALLAKAKRREEFPYPWLPDEVIREVGFLDNNGPEIRRYAPHLYGQIPQRKSGSVTTKSGQTALLCVEEGLGLAPMSDLLVRELHFEDRVQLFSFGPWPRSTWLTVLFDPHSLLEEETAYFVQVARSCYQS